MGAGRTTKLDKEAEDKEAEDKEAEDKEAEKWLAGMPGGLTREKIARPPRSTKASSGTERQWLPSQSDSTPVGPPPASGSPKAPGLASGRRRLALRRRRVERKLEEAERRNQALERRNEELEERLAAERRKNNARARKAKPAKPAMRARKNPARKGKLDANAVSLEQLCDLGFTATQSARYIAHRDLRNGFSSTTAFDEIPGFSSAARAKLKTRLKVGRKTNRSKP